MYKNKTFHENWSKRTFEGLFHPALSCPVGAVSLAVLRCQDHFVQVISKRLLCRRLLIPSSVLVHLYLLTVRTKQPSPVPSENFYLHRKFLLTIASFPPYMELQLFVVSEYQECWPMRRGHDQLSSRHQGFQLLQFFPKISVNSSNLRISRIYFVYLWGMLYVLFSATTLVFLFYFFILALGQEPIFSGFVLNVLVLKGTIYSWCFSTIDNKDPV